MSYGDMYYLMDDGSGCYAAHKLEVPAAIPLKVGNFTPLGGATNPIVAMLGSSNNYVQAYVQNVAAGVSASADKIVYPNNGTDLHGWGDLGVTSSTYADPVYTVTGVNEVYLFASAPSGSNTSGNLVFATDSTGTANAFQWYTGGFTQVKTAYKMLLDSLGNLLTKPPVTPPTLAVNGDMVMNATANTNLRISLRGSDGVTRVANITLA